MKAVCFACNTGYFHEIVELEETVYNNHLGLVPLYYCKCDVCDVETATQEQTKLNKYLMERFRRQCEN